MGKKTDTIVSQAMEIAELREIANNVEGHTSYIKGERDEYKNAYEVAEKSRQSMASDFEQVIKKSAKIVEDQLALQKENERLHGDITRLTQVNAEQVKTVNETTHNYNNLQEQYNHVTAKYGKLFKHARALEREYVDAENYLIYRAPYQNDEQFHDVSAGEPATNLSQAKSDNVLQESPKPKRARSKPGITCCSICGDAIPPDEGRHMDGKGGFTCDACIPGEDEDEDFRTKI